MLPELGHFALILAACFALSLTIFPLLGTYLPRFSPWRAMIAPLGVGQGVFIAIAYALLTYAFYSHDFSVAYVANNSHESLVWYYRLCAVWGAHEGSMLLWLALLAAWSAAFIVCSSALDAVVRVRTASVLGAIGFAVNSFILLTSNPFARLLVNIPKEGADLNPLLQDVGFILHPPILYMGYVGLAIAFALAIGVMLSRKPLSLMQQAESWTKGAWAFLTLGITLGSWWAYYELGWGGWWFWDPVENAALIPWLMATALVHAMMGAKREASFSRWVILLSLAGFASSLLGTFLVRSGVLSSVHSFASDPKRGIYLLHLLVFFTGGGLWLFSRTPMPRSSGFSVFSRGAVLISNNVLLLSAAAVVLLGTLYPLFLEWAGNSSISVGAPYFNATVLPLWAPLCLLVGLAPYLLWQGSQGRAIVVQILLPITMAILIAFIEGPWAGLGAWIVLGTLASALKRLKSVSARHWPMRYWGMLVAHIGMGVCVLGGALTTTYSVEKDVRLELGQSVDVAGYRFTFEDIQRFDDAHSEHLQASVHAKAIEGRWQDWLAPEKQFFKARKQVMTETAIDPGFLRDLYVALGDSREDGSWTFRLYVKPYVRWLWLGGVLMAFGIGLSLIDRRSCR